MRHTQAHKVQSNRYVEIYEEYNVSVRHEGA